MRYGKNGCERLACTELWIVLVILSSGADCRLFSCRFPFGALL